MRPPHPLSFVLVVISSACVGNVGPLPGEPGPARTGEDPPIMLMEDDAGRPPVDSGRDAGDTSVEVDASDDAEVPPPPPPEPCDGVVCSMGAACVPETGECACVEGYRPVSTGCEAIPPGDPAGRTTAEVCTRWNEGHAENARPAWTAGPSACDLGTIAPGAYEDTIRRINLFRWLTGLPAVVHQPADNDAMQECAVMMDQNGRLSHSPPSTWQCYTTEGARAAGRSNLALGSRSPGDAIDLYVADARVASLGHRRWVLSNYLGRVGIGFAGRAQCLGVFDTSGRGDREWTSYPNAGPAPIQTTQNVWSFHSHSINLGAATVRMERLGAVMEEIPVTVIHVGGGFGPPGAVGWSPSIRASAGDRFRITIGGLSVADISYEMEIVGC